MEAVERGQRDGVCGSSDKGFMLTEAGIEVRQRGALVRAGPAK